MLLLIENLIHIFLYRLTKQLLQVNTIYNTDYFMGKSV